jgi:hypothetical protein
MRPKRGAVLGFDDRRILGGSYVVLGEDGAPVARVAPSFWRSRFVATLPESDETGEPGDVICTGKARPITGWVAHDPEGAELVRLRVRPFHHHKTTLRGGELQCRSINRAFAGEWFFQVSSAQNLLTSVSSQGRPYPPDVWSVETDGTLTLAEVVAVVELHRLELKRKRRRHPSSARMVRRRRRQQSPVGRVA